MTKKLNYGFRMKLVLATYEELKVSTEILVRLVYEWKSSFGVEACTPRKNVVPHRGFRPKQQVFTLSAPRSMLPTANLNSIFNVSRMSNAECSSPSDG